MKPKTLPITNGAYHTQPRRVSLVARAIPSGVLYLRQVIAILRDAAQVKLGNYDGAAWARSSFGILRALEGIGIKFDITGMEHLQNLDGPCLIVANHMSTLETMVLPSIVQPLKRTTFVVKEQLVTYPVFQHVMRSQNPISISQVNPREDLLLMMTGVKSRVADGISVIIFPEGERSGYFNPNNFNSIGVKLAGRAGVPVIPLALRTDAWALGRFFPDFGKIDPSIRVHFRFGAPVQIKGKGGEQNREIIKFIEGSLAEWADESGDLIERDMHQETVLNT